jgi:hypothetical protein
MGACVTPNGQVITAGKCQFVVSEPSLTCICMMANPIGRLFIPRAIYLSLSAPFEPLTLGDDRFSVSRWSGLLLLLHQFRFPFSKFVPCPHSFPLLLMSSPSQSTQHCRTLSFIPAEAQHGLPLPSLRSSNKLSKPVLVLGFHITYLFSMPLPRSYVASSNMS